MEEEEEEISRHWVDCLLCQSSLLAFPIYWCSGAIFSYNDNKVFHYFAVVMCWSSANQVLHTGNGMILQL